MLTPHLPIVISGNVDFTAANGVTGGTGTASDPYIIEGWNITSRAIFGPAGITINDTSAYFVIRNVYTNDAANPGIRMKNVTNGAVGGSYVSAYPNSLTLDSSRNILIFNDTIYYYASIGSSYNVTLINNKIGNVFATSSTDVYIIDNQFHGVRCQACIDTSSGVTISGNDIPGCDCVSVSVSRSDHVSMTDNIIGGDVALLIGESSTVDISNNKITGGIDHGVSLGGCSDLSFRGNRVRAITDQYPFVEVDSCNGVDISGNSIAPQYFEPYYKEDLLRVSRSSNIMIAGNDLLNATSGQGTSDALIVSDSSSARIIANNIESNGQGILLDNTQSFQVFHNNFINNVVQAIDTNSSQNSWDDGYPGGGNYWSGNKGVDNCSGIDQNVCPSPDGISDTLYSFSLAEDRYPLMHPSAPAVTGMVQYSPSTVNSQSKTRSLTAIIQLPLGVDGSTVVASSIRVNGTVSLASGRLVLQVTKGGQQLSARFATGQLLALFPSPGTYVLEVSGNIVTTTSFRPFSASAPVRFIGT